MKNLIFIFILLICFSGRAYTQLISESIVKLSKVYTPIFKSESAVLSIDFIKNYELTQKDTNRFVLIQINSQTSQIEGYTTGISLFSVGSLFGVGSSGQVLTSINRDKGSAVFNYVDFQKFYSGLSSVYTFIKSQASFGKRKTDIVASVNFDNLIFGGEFSPSQSSNINFYFSFGNAKFRMSETEFYEIVKTCNQIKDAWNLKP